MKRSELRNLIHALGGPKVIGAACGISSQAVSHWVVCPQEHAPVLETLARQKRVIRSNGELYTCEVLRPDLADRFAMIRGAPATSTLVDVA